jgi:hypothetical protein
MLGSSRNVARHAAESARFFFLVAPLDCGLTTEWLALQLPFIIINTGKDDDVECEIDDNM